MRNFSTNVTRTFNGLIHSVVTYLVPPSNTIYRPIHPPRLSLVYLVMNPPRSYPMKTDMNLESDHYSDPSSNEKWIVRKISCNHNFHQLLPPVQLDSPILPSILSSKSTLSLTRAPLIPEHEDRYRIRGRQI